VLGEPRVLVLPRQELFDGEVGLFVIRAKIEDTLPRGLDGREVARFLVRMSETSKDRRACIALHARLDLVERLGTHGCVACECSHALELAPALERGRVEARRVTQRFGCTRDVPATLAKLRDMEPSLHSRVNLGLLVLRHGHRAVLELLRAPGELVRRAHLSVHLGQRLGRELCNALEGTERVLEPPRLTLGIRERLVRGYPPLHAHLRFESLTPRSRGAARGKVRRAHELVIVALALGRSHPHPTGRLGIARCVGERPEQTERRHTHVAKRPLEQRNPLCNDRRCAGSSSGALRGRTLHESRGVRHEEDVLLEIGVRLECPSKRAERSVGVIEELEREQGERDRDARAIGTDELARERMAGLREAHVEDRPLFGGTHEQLTRGITEERERGRHGLDEGGLEEHVDAHLHALVASSRDLGRPQQPSRPHARARRGVSDLLDRANGVAHIPCTLGNPGELEERPTLGRHCSKRLRSVLERQIGFAAVVEEPRATIMRCATTKAPSSA